MTDTWAAPKVTRVEPSFESDERTSLEQWVDYHRATLLTKCAGLNAAQLRQRPVSPSRLSLLGLVRHMADVERWWFRMHGAQEDIGLFFDSDWSGRDFEGVDEADAAADLAAFGKECEAARSAVAGRSLDDVVQSRGDQPGQVNIRWIYVHMIEEYARHNGHADLLREAIDGVTGE
jgi:uncharacterized damage-inducible protein DinB